MADKGDEERLPPEKRLGWAVVGLGEFSTAWFSPARLRAKRSRLAGLVSGDRAMFDDLGGRWRVPEAAGRAMA